MPRVAWLWLAALLLALGASQAQPTAAPPPAPPTTDASAEALLSLPAACTNWDAATAGLAGAPWANGTDPCDPAWKGVTCEGSLVTMLLLPGLGLEGTLPAALGGLQSLDTLNLSGNAFAGTLPPEWLLPTALLTLADADLSRNRLTGTLPSQLVLLASTHILLGGNALTGWLPSQWSSATLEQLDLSANQLGGLLPADWGDKTALPNLSTLGLEGNQLRGPIPDPQWVSVGFAAPCDVYARPGNPALCGPLLELDPQLYDPALLLDPTTNYTNKKPTSGRLSNLTTLVVWQEGLFGAATTVAVTNTLGSCFLPCSEVGVSPDSAVVLTNFFDMTWQRNVSAADLARLNPGGALASAGDVLALPCYPPGQPTLGPQYFGSSTAYLRFSGGNQVAGPEGLQGAMAASGTNDHVPNLNDFDNPYNGSMALQAGPTPSLVLVQPVWLFVDMEAELQVTAVVLTAGAAMRNASIYIGSNNASVVGNALVAWELDLAPRQQRAVPVGGASGRYVIVYTGTAEEGAMSVSDFQVYTAETNAAAHKPVEVSALGPPSSRRLADDAPAQALVDGLPGSCAAVHADGTNSTAWAAIQLGYTATVGAVSVLGGSGVPHNTQVRAYVTDAVPTGSLPDSAACGGGGAPLASNGWATTPCNATGSVVVVAFATASAVDLCEVQVALTQGPVPGTIGPIGWGGAAPSPPPSPGDGGNSSSSSSSSGLSAGAIAGIAVAAAAGTAALVLAAVWVRRRQRRSAGAAPSAKQPSWDSESGGVSGGPAEWGGDRGFDVGVGAAAPPLAKRSAGMQSAVARSLGSASNASSGQRLVATPERGGSLDTGHSSDAPTDAALTDLAKLPAGFADVSASEFDLQRIVGSGSFGEVWMARYCETNVAVKMLTDKSHAGATTTAQHQAALRALHQEAGLMSRLRHPNICQYLGACLDPPCLLMEFCAKRSIDVQLSAGLTDRKVAKHLTWGRLLAMALDAAKGMLYLHSRAQPIAHRDLKSANLLVDSQWRVKVADFNLSRTLDPDQGASTLFITNPRWLAPEVLSGRPGQLAADVWAFGTVLWELATWRLPFENMNPFQIITIVQCSADGSGLVPPPPDQLPGGPLLPYAEYCQLMRDCWQRDPARRPRFEEVVRRVRLMLTAELRQRQDGGGGVAAPHDALSQQHSGALDAALVAAVAHSASGGEAQARRAQSGTLLPTPAPALSGGARGGIPRAPSHGLDDAAPVAATPFAALSQTPASPLDGPSPRDS